MQQKKAKEGKIPPIPGIELQVPIPPLLPGSFSYIRGCHATGQITCAVNIIQPPYHSHTACTKCYT